MKKKIILTTNCLLLLLMLYAQSEKFDIASFVAPQGWQRIDSNGKLGFFDAKTDNGRTTFCQILLYPSRKSSGNAVKDFNEDWTSKIVKNTGTKNKPKTQIQKSPEGWNVVTGYTNISQQGNTYTCMLTTISGYGKAFSVLVNIAGQDYLTAVDDFFKNLELDKAGVANTTTANNQNKQNTVTTGTGSLANYVYAEPPGWTTTVYTDGIVVSAPVSNTGEKCNISLWPMRSSTGSLQNDANALFAQVFSSFEPRNSSTPNSMIKGTSAQGWDYFMIKKSIGLRGGDFQTMFGFVFVANLGNQVAAISGISKDPLVSSCFGLQLTDVWPKFFYSLQFKNWSSSNSSAFLKNLPGVWMTATGTSGDRMVFAPNGRFAGASASQKYYRVSGTEVMRTTDAYFGDGSYSINGNSIVLTSDNDKSHPEYGFVRLEQESKDEGRTWTPKLYLLRKSVMDGSEYEVGYEKQNN
jgi:hypothetical protein